MEVISPHSHRPDSHSLHEGIILTMYTGAGIMGTILELCLPQCLTKLAIYIYTHTHIYILPSHH